MYCHKIIITTVFVSFFKSNNFANSGDNLNFFWSKSKLRYIFAFTSVSPFRLISNPSTSSKFEGLFHFYHKIRRLLKKKEWGERQKTYINRDVVIFVFICKNASLLLIKCYLNVSIWIQFWISI